MSLNIYSEKQKKILELQKLSVFNLIKLSILSIVNQILIIFPPSSFTLKRKNWQYEIFKIAKILPLDIFCNKKSVQ